MTKRFPLWMALAALISTSFAYSQDQPLGNESLEQMLAPRGKISLKGGYVPSKTVNGENDSIKQSEFSLTSSIPLFQNVTPTERKVMRGESMKTAEHQGPSVFGMSLSPGLGGNEVYGLGTTQRDLHLYNAKMGLGAHWLSSGGEFYFASVGTSVTGEWDSPKALGWLPYGFFLGTDKLSESVRFLYGAAFSFAYGTGLPLPILGVAWTISDTSRLIAILPFILKYKQNLSDSWDLNAFLAPAGFQSRFQNQGSFQNSAESTLTIKSRAFKLGAGIDYKPNQDWKLSAEGGLLAARQFTVSDSSQDLYVFQPNHSGYVMAGVTYHFGGSAKGGVVSDLEDF